MFYMIATLTRELRSSDAGRKQHQQLGILCSCQDRYPHTERFSSPAPSQGPPWDAHLSCTNTTCHIIWCLGTFSMLIFKHMLQLQNIFSKRVCALFLVSNLLLWFNIGVFVFLDVWIFLKQYVRGYARYDLFNSLALHPLSLHRLKT